MRRAFTLIELLIVVAIIAILAAIAVPNFLEAQVRAKVSRVRNDLRSLATGIESYYVDNNQYPVSARVGRTPAGVGNVNVYVPGAPAILNEYSSFSAQAVSGPQATLTTPISYITSYFSDPFTNTRGATFGYFSDTNGWILWSPGPDTDEDTRTDLAGCHDGQTPSVETVYTSSISQPSLLLVAGRNTNHTDGDAFTYDPTNGTVSGGDVYRVKQ